MQPIGCELRELLILAYASAVGFSVSGAISTFLQLVTRRPVAFAMPEGGARAPTYILTALSFMAIGPYVMARTSIRLRFREGGPLSVFAAGLTISLMWSLCFGIALMGLVLAAYGG